MGSWLLRLSLVTATLVHSFPVAPLVGPPLPRQNHRRPHRFAITRTTALNAAASNNSDNSNNNSDNSNNSNAARDEAAALLERARKMREDVAALTGESVHDLEQAALEKKERRKQVTEQAAAERAEQQRRRNSNNNSQTRNGSFLEVPETPDDQIIQAKAAVERAFADGHTRQVVRFALVPEGETLNEKDRPWPGGPQQMYREAAGPLTRELLRVVRATTKTETNNNNAWSKPPTVGSRDIWDFDGSALVTAQHASASSDVQAMVLSNTDSKYTDDIATLDVQVGDQRLFVLVNPFWRNLESWGVNLLAPNAKKKAQAAIFDRGFLETYHVVQKSVRGEDCVAIKAYPYDWQLHAYIEMDGWPYGEYSVRLGSTPEEPTAVDFAKLLEEREEFKMSKNMRQMQRMMRKDE